MNNKDIESGGNPFLKTLGYTSIIIIFCIVLVYIIRMLKTTWAGYKSDNNNINDINYFTSSKNYNILIFIVETILVVGLLNIIPPLLGPMIRKEHYKNIIIFIDCFLYFTYNATV